MKQDTKQFLRGFFRTLEVLLAVILVYALVDLFFVYKESHENMDQYAMDTRLPDDAPTVQPPPAPPQNNMANPNMVPPNMMRPPNAQPAIMPPRRRQPGRPGQRPNPAAQARNPAAANPPASGGGGSPPTIRLNGGGSRTFTVFNSGGGGGGGNNGQGGRPNMGGATNLAAEMATTNRAANSASHAGATDASPGAPNDGRIGFSANQLVRPNRRGFRFAIP